MTHPLRLPLACIAAAIVAGCSMMQPPADLDQRLSRSSEHALYTVTIRPLVQALPINQLHAWDVAVTSAAGVPVTDARIAVDGGMPQHHHGFPTAPRITENLGEGHYRLDGVKFSMSGWWEIKLQVNAAQGSDRVVFNTVVADPASAPAVAAR